MSFAKYLRYFSVVALFAAGPAYSQYSFGVKAGVSMTDAYTNNPIADGGSGHFNDRYTAGLTAEYRFTTHFSLEADVLYRHSGFDAIGGFLANTPNGSVDVKDFQVPILVKYEVTLGRLQPFVDFGAAYRHLSTSGRAAPELQDAQHADIAGPVIGVGVAFKWRRVKISPELRYSGWSQTAFNNVAVTSNQNQGDFLVGFTF